jgi:2-isopropylmalate synthase
MRRAGGWSQPFFELESYRVIVSEADDVRHDTEAIVKLKVDGERIMRIGEGNGPVNALDAAVRAAIGARYPQLAKVHLTDFKVRVLDTAKGTGAVTRVLIDSTNGRRSWSTIGVSENIIQAAWQALEDSLVYGLLHTEE